MWWQKCGGNTIVRFRRGNMAETRPVHEKLDHHVSAGRKRDGYKKLPVSVEFPKYGNTLFRPVDFVKCILRFCCKFSRKIIFLPPSEHREAKVRRFLGICLYDCFIYRSNFVFRNFSKRDAISASVSKKPRIFRVTGANQNARKLLFTDLVNTKQE